MKISSIIVATILAAVAMSPADARPAQSTTAFDGTWQLTFTTKSGACDASYDFNVNIANGAISHPMLVRFNGNVASNGAVRASVTVQDKSASGAGRLTATNGGGNWSGYSGAAKCSGSWVAHRS